jgi:hypothetical protein
MRRDGFRVFRPTNHFGMHTPARERTAYRLGTLLVSRHAPACFLRVDPRLDLVLRSCDSADAHFHAAGKSPLRLEKVNHRTAESGALQHLREAK